MTILVIGGAGYIGSHMLKRLIEEGERLVVLDNLSTGYLDAVLGGTFILGDCGTISLIADIVKRHDIDTVMHFASFIQVGESVSDPIPYYVNNVVNTLQLLDAMIRSGVKNFIFSSSAAVYGNAANDPIKESCACAPVNPYGRTKRIIEEALHDLAFAYGLNFFSLRYFNAAGAARDARIGERHDPETHLIPLVLQAASGRREAITIFGRDYPTPDGTCIRDYIHVEDLCEAHLLALQALRRGQKGGYFNLGTSAGFSVADVLDAARRITGKQIRSIDAERRPGDPPVLVADASAFQASFGWRPRMPGLEPIVESAWRWETEFFVKGKRW